METTQRPATPSPVGRAARFSPRATIAILLSALLVLSGTGGWLIAASQTSWRGVQTNRLDATVKTAAGFVADYVDQVKAHTNGLAVSSLAGTVNDARLAQFAQDNEMSSATLLDVRGHVLAAAGDQRGAGFDADVHAAQHGTAAVSGVLSTTSGIPVLRYAVPFDLPGGRRVMVVAYPLDNSLLRSFLGIVLSTYGSAQFDVLDTADLVVASNGTDRLTPLVPERAPAPARQLLAGASGARSGVIGDGGDQRYFATEPVRNSSWRLVVSVPTTELFARFGGTSGWIPWLALAACTLTGLLAIGLLGWYLTARRLHERHLRDLALSDTLTGSANRRAFTARLEQAQARAGRHDSHLAVLFADVDHFKSINDTYGHAIGDAVLIQVAERLRGQFRVEDTVARLGGDEFAVLIEDLARSEGPDLTRRVQDCLSTPYVVGTEIIPAGVSIGIATGNRNEPVAELLQRADVLMYRAKQSARTGA